MYIFHDPNYMYIVSTLYIYYKLFSLWPLGTVQDLNDQSTKSSNFYFYTVESSEDLNHVTVQCINILPSGYDNKYVQVKWL